MSAPTSVEELLQLIRKSGMVDENKLSSYVHRRQTGRGLSGDPREAAEAMVADGLITGFQMEQFLLGKWRGFTVGKYKLLERVGVGGMGQVFLCEHLYMKRRVAVKVLPPAKAEQPAALGRFYREARAAGSIEHPNIVRTHDIDQDGNLHYIVMEYVDGSNLLDLVKKFGPLDVRRAVHYIRQAAVGLQYAFQNGIIHRDIKPGNILIDRRGTSKLLDMGLARFYHDQTDMLTIKYDDKIVLGTADYVAPEQVANSHAVDVRADIYALGASLYFLLAGHPPFPTGTVSQKLLWHRTKDPTPIRQIRPEVPEGLAAVVAKMMQKDPNARHNTPAEVVADLEKWAPADIPPPSADEMPTLSPAAAEALEQCGPDNPIQSTPVSELRKVAAAVVKPSPFAAPSQPVPEPPTPAPTVEPVRLQAAAERYGRTAMAEPPPVRPRLAPPLPGARAEAVVALQSTAALSAQETPRPEPPFPGAFPVITMPREEVNTNRTPLVLGLVAVAVVLAVGLFLYKFVLSQPTAGQPAPQAVETTGN
jgi:serine/threonine protein kinase